MAATVDSKTEIGQQVPEVTLPRVDGGTLRLRDLAGRRVLLFCWASW